MCPVPKSNQSFVKFLVKSQNSSFFIFKNSFLPLEVFIIHPWILSSLQQSNLIIHPVLFLGSVSSSDSPDHISFSPLSPPSSLHTPLPSWFNVYVSNILSLLLFFLISLVSFSVTSFTAVIQHQGSTTGHQS